MADPTSQQPFDVFLSHNSKDKPAVIALAQRLQANGVKVWLDAWVLDPGHPWLKELEQVIKYIPMAAVLVGADGIGGWQDAEISACLEEATKRKLPVIPVLLADCPREFELPMFLRRFTWVDLRGGREEDFKRLIRVINGMKPPPIIPVIQAPVAEKDDKIPLGESVKPAKADGKPAPSKHFEAIRLSCKNFISVVWGWRRSFPKSTLLRLALLALLALIVWKMSGIEPFGIEFRVKTAADAQHDGAAAKDGPPASSPAVTNDGKPITAIVEPAMVSLSGGEFWMGSDKKADPMAFNYESPRHKVTVQPFSIGKYEVTVGEYAAFVKATNHQSQGCWVYSGSTWRTDASKSWSDPGFQQTDRNPVVCVSHEDAQAYVHWLRDNTGKAYRLPTEAEWEYAGRAGQDTLFCGGDDADAVAWHFGNSGGKTHPVGGKQPNAFGLYDMSGNAWEWVQDCWHDTYQGAPADGSAWGGGAECVGRVLRGGAFDDIQLLVRCAYRHYADPAFRSSHFGFRVVVSP